MVIEDLNVAGMVKNHCLAKAISDSAMGELARQIEYKADWNGIEVVKADRWFPSSKTCSRCGCIQDSLTLADRVFHCNDCNICKFASADGTTVVEHRKAIGAGAIRAGGGLG